jgi:hypothetical protein
VAGGQRVTRSRGHARGPARGAAVLAAGLLAGLLPCATAGPAAAATTAPTSSPATTPAATPTTPAAPATVRAQVLLTGISPAAVKPRDTIVLSGRVTNRGTVPLAAGRVSVRLNPTNLKTREAVRTWTARGALADTRPVAGAVPFPALQPGASAAFTLRVRAADLDLPARGEDWGPRGIAVEATTAAGRAGFTRTTIVWFPRKEFNPTQLTLMAPVTTPRGADVAAPSAELAGAFAPGGTVARLLDAAADPVIAWAVDPALLQVARTVAGQDTGTGSTPAVTPTPTTGGSTPTPSPSPSADPAQRAAAAGWLERMRDSRGQRDVVMLPYGDPDLVALSRSDPKGMMLRGADLRARTVTKAVFGEPVEPTVAWPAGGAADRPTLAAAAARGRTAVILGSRTQPATGSPGVTPTGRSTVVAGSGTLDGLLYDEQLSTLFGATGGPRGATATQQLVAELAAITWELPSESRNVLAVAPRGWQPDPHGVAAAMTALRTTPWISLRTLSDLRRTAPTAARAQPRYPSSSARSELPAEHVAAVSSLYEDVARFAPALGPNKPVVEPILARCLMLVSAAWRRDRRDIDVARAPVAREVHELVGGVHIVRGTPRPYFLASEASLPVYVANGTPYPVQVVVTLRPRSGGLVIERPVAVDLAPNTRRQQVLVPTKALASGDVQIAASVRTPGGALIGTERELVVRVRREWETRGIIGIGTLLVVLLAFGLLRGVRRDRTRVRPEDVPDVDDLASAAGDRAAARRDAIEEAAREEGQGSQDTAPTATDGDRDGPAAGSGSEAGTGQAITSPDGAAGEVAVDVGETRDRPVMSREHR